MKKRDLLTPIGITLGFIMLVFAIGTGGDFNDLTTFLDFPSVFIVIGGLIGSMLISFNSRQIKLTGSVVKESFHKTEDQLSDLIQLFIHLSERARREGLLALENELEDVEDPFIKKGVMLAVDGIEPEVITDILNAEITAMEDRHYKGRSLIEKAGEYAPAWGMIGTLIGLILMLNQLSEPETLGPAMAVALTTTLYGTLLANLVFIPMSNKLQTKTEEEIFVKQITIEGIIGVQSGQNPRILEEKLSAFISNDAKEKYEENIIEESDSQIVGDRVNES